MVLGLLAIPAKDVLGVICPLALILFMLICGGLMYFAGSQTPKSKTPAVKAPRNPSHHYNLHAQR
jgi:hypothetical protein